MSEEAKPIEVTIELTLTVKQWTGLVFTLGYAAGVAMERQDTELAQAFKELGQALIKQREKQ